MNSEKKVSRARAVLCVLLCVVFGVLTTYQTCFYIIFKQYQDDLNKTKKDMQATIDAKTAENEALLLTVASLEGQVNSLTERLTALAGKTDATPEDCLRHLLRLGLIEHGKNANIAPDAYIDELVDSYMAANAADAMGVAARLLFIDFLYRKNYYGPAPSYEAAQEAMIEGYISAAHDVYAKYYTPDEYADFLDKMNASVSGIGAVTGFRAADHCLIVMYTHTNSPAREAGLQKNDRIVAVDSRTFSSAAEATGMIGGAEGDKVRLTVERDGYPGQLFIDIVRARVTTDTVIAHTETAANDERIGYLRIVSFNNNTLSQFETAYASLLSEGVTGLVLDLRDNTGGLLQPALDLLDRILDRDLPLVSYDYKNPYNAEAPVLSRDDGKTIDLPITLLVNRNTASAAEIFAAALRSNRADVRLVGEATTGKGVIQTRYPLGDGSYVYATVAAYVSPAFDAYPGTGKLPPDDEIALAEGLQTLPIYLLEAEDDLPLQHAISITADPSSAH